MDERFRGKGIWIAVGGLAIIFLCLMLCGLGAMGTMFMRQGGPAVPQIQAPAGEEGAVPPPVYYGPGQHAGYGPFGFIGAGISLLFKLLFFGLLLVLFIGLIRRLIWGPRYWHHAPWGRAPQGQEWKGKPHPGWGPWAHHWYGRYGEKEEEPTGTEGEPDEPDPVYRGAE